MKLIMPMAGLATRFNKNSSELIIKPLIDVKGRKLYQWAMDPFRNLISDSDRIFIIQKSHHELEKILRVNHPQDIIKTLNGPTRGPGETLSFAMDLMDSTPVVVCDCDLYFESGEFEQFILSREKNTDSGVLTFFSDKPQYSYVIQENGFVKDINEKKVISNQAVCGCYYFSSGTKLKGLVESTYERIKEREIFLSDVIKTSLLKGERCRSFKCDIHVSLGTPEELKENADSLPRE